MTGPHTEVVVLDIEGTTGSLTYVRDVLFPYARRELAGWFTRHAQESRVRQVAEDVRTELDRPDLDTDGVVAALAAWSDADVKAAPLKTVQGWIWAEGYASGALHGHVYPEVPAALRAWKAAGVRVVIYSSGSAAAQLDWFRHTAYGDLSPLLDGYFDLRSAGSKTDPASYRTLAGAVGAHPGRLLFLSDVAAELDAAVQAGWHAVGVRREGDPRGPAVPRHRTVATLDPLLPGPSSASRPQETPASPESPQSHEVSPP
ncbi:MULTISPECIES: acireductone synthase [Streptomyces]|uniref:Enolase-phosphatase E1 n=1 Tax=Streptomyces griseofuscus TaxID=146922 RepID=A0A7H1PTB2_9ACTN|nr:MULTISPECIES: acireductone synthase [Streptomyces]MBA9049595.1 enolase-phosphatase E1 [Streptomyces murinus]QNT91292.1 Enolase-phosphatase E1 [Streptomyces griseofuscus]